MRADQALTMDANLLAFIGLAALLTITPGADMALVTRNAIARGFSDSFSTTLGICSGCLLHAAGSSAGLSAILSRSSAVFEAVKLVGALYLIFLGIQSLRIALKPGDATLEVKGAGVMASSRSWAKGFVEGLLTNLLNPKVALFYLTFLPQFIRPEDPVLARSLLLGSIHIGFGLVWLTAYAAFIGKLGAYLARPRIRRRLEAVTGGLLVLLGLRLALERR